MCNLTHSTTAQRTDKRTAKNIATHTGRQFLDKQLKKWRPATTLKTGRTEKSTVGQNKFNKMKAVKFLFMIAIAALFTMTITSCKKKCNGEDPRARIINNGTQKAGVQIKTSGGNTVNINDVQAGTSSGYSSYAAGQVTFTLKVNNIDYVKTVAMSQCYDYDIAIDVNGNITSTAISRN